jgi:hypothetical protein
VDIQGWNRVGGQVGSAFRTSPMCLTESGTEQLMGRNE